MLRPQLSDEGLGASVSVVAYDEFGQARDGHIAAERALTIYLDKREILTLMTLGSQPELLVLGWLKNQNLVDDLTDIESVHIAWDVEAAAIKTRSGGVEGLDKKMEHRTVTTGCGQGTMFGNLMDNLSKVKLPRPQVKQSQIYDLLKSLNAHNDVYRKAGAVHGCALCQGTEILCFVEDVGRHNAVDTIAGYMWYEGISGDDKWFYTTGRLTSEMVIKVAQMGIPILLSRSGVTQMGLELAQQLGVVLIARAKGRHFLVYQGAEQIEFDAQPDKPTSAKPG
ncbi:formate dehydrogenase accessory sulfurtransferase FdhD [Leucothrix pacifica]|uniref:Sulfur carrier protein FdhD n=1 Tax=Leucothrix pacifica TaxID=1247513 RepID=A0A317CC15_9GAMM|nr:formate dehydrogenase accessory sulfurtransferase FdhD [Leucothrix pacifica]PWQ96098.1 sulfurtransferase FdhD [Leucothrix pacifica]